jgi:hypothetical protein
MLACASDGVARQHMFGLKHKARHRPHTVFLVQQNCSKSWRSTKSLLNMWRTW